MNNKNLNIENKVDSNEKQKEDIKTKVKNSKKRNFIVPFFLIAISIGLYIMFRGAYLEKLSIGEQYVSVFWQNFKYKTITLSVTAIVLFILFYTTNKRIYKGLKSFFDDEKKAMPKLPNKSISLIISVIASLFTSGITTNKLILFLNSTSFEMEDKIFNNDIGYYLFQKPFLEYIVIFGIITLIAMTIYMGIYYIVALNTQFDGVRTETLRKSRIVKQILSNTKVLSILIAILTFLKTQDLSASRFLTIGDKTIYSLYGAGFSDITLKLWGYRLLSVLIVITVFLAISAYNKGKTKKVIGYIATVPTYLCLLLVTLFCYNEMFVESNELEKQKNYIHII